MIISASDAEPEKPHSDVFSGGIRLIDQSSFNDELDEGDDHEPQPIAIVPDRLDMNE